MLNKNLHKILELLIYIRCVCQCVIVCEREKNIVEKKSEFWIIYYNLLEWAATY